MGLAVADCQYDTTVKHQKVCHKLGWQWAYYQSV